MLIVAGTLLALLLVPVLGGRLGRLAHLRLHARWLVVYVLALQVLAISVVPDGPRPAVVALHASSYCLAAAFVWVNRDVAGLPLLASGAALNAVAIAVNGGQMPASSSALRAAGLPTTREGGYGSSGVVDDPRLAFLGDVFASPAWLPLRNVFSVGDLLVLAGVVWLVHRTCRTAQARDPRPAGQALRRRLRRTSARAAQAAGRQAPVRTVIIPDQYGGAQDRRYVVDSDDSRAG